MCYQLDNNYDCLYQNVNLVDGLGNEIVYGIDVAIKDGIIKKIAKNIDVKLAKEVKNYEGKYLAPGFIDTHGHTDLVIFKEIKNKIKLNQGITRELSGNCGMSYFPVSKKNYEDNTNGFMSTAVDNVHRKDFTTGEKFFSEVKKLDTDLKYHYLVGHGVLRETVMGYENRPATKEELEQMKELLEEGMKSGAKGMSTGLAYAPGQFSTNEEIEELCKIVAKYNGVYTTHMRNQAHDILKSVKDSIDISRKTGCTTIISHLKLIGHKNYDKCEKVLDLINKAQEEGLKVFCDAYPYTAGSTTLTITLPPSLLEGGEKNLKEIIDKPEIQEYIKSEFENPTESWENAIGNSSFDAFKIVAAPNTPEAVNLTIAEYSKKIGKNEFETYFYLLKENGAKVATMNNVMSEENVIEILKNKYVMIGSDGSAGASQNAHPRNFGTFPRYLGRYVRDKKILSLEEAIRKITSLPAKVLGLERVGVIKEGYIADIVIFDYDTIIDKKNNEVIGIKETLVSKEA